MTTKYECGHHLTLSELYENLSLKEKVLFIRWKASKYCRCKLRCYDCWLHNGQ